MPSFTPNIGLKKPSQNDFYNIDDFNYNSDIIDNILGGFENSFVSTTRKINNKPLSSDITLNADDVGARSNSWFPTASEVNAVPVSRTINGYPLTYDVLLSATDVGAKPATWTPDPTEIGAVPSSRTINGKALTSNISLSSTDVGAIPLTMKGSANGVAETDANGKILASHLPSYVDDVAEFADKASFPATGESGKIYIDMATNLTYRWGGSAYVEISQSVALGETSSTAYRGDRGKTAYDHSVALGNPHSTTPADIGAVPTTTKVNNKALSGNITLTAADVSAVPTTRKINGKGLGADVTLTAADVGASGLSTPYSATIGTTWVGTSTPYTQVISLEGIKTTSVIEVSLPSTATQAQTEAFDALKLKDGGQAVDQFTLRCWGDKNTINIPISVIVRGDM